MKLKVQYEMSEKHSNIKSVTIDPTGKIRQTLEFGAFDTEKVIASMNAVARLYTGGYSVPNPSIHVLQNGLEEVVKAVVAQDRVRFIFSTGVANVVSSDMSTVTNMTKDGPVEVPLYRYFMRLSFKALGKQQAVSGKYVSRTPMADYNQWLLASMDLGGNWKFRNPMQKIQYRFNLLHSMIKHLCSGTQVKCFVYPVRHEGAAEGTVHLQNKALWLKDILLITPAQALVQIQSERAEYAEGDATARKADVPAPVEGVARDDFEVRFQVNGKELKTKTVKTANWSDVPVKDPNGKSRQGVIYQALGSTFKATGRKMRFTGRNTYRALREISVNDQVIHLID